MDLLTNSKEKIEELNNRFFYIMENFIPKYINYLRDPKDDNNKSEITRINDVITNINSDAHVLQNQLQVAIDNLRINEPESVSEIEIEDLEIKKVIELFKEEEQNPTSNKLVGFFLGTRKFKNETQIIYVILCYLICLFKKCLIFSSSIIFFAYQLVSLCSSHN